MKPSHTQLLLFCLFWVLSLCLSGCGFHLRSSQPLPPTLHSLNVNLKQSDDYFNTELLAMLTNLGIQVSPQGDSAPLTLSTSKLAFTHNNPNISSSNQAVTYHYKLIITLKLQNNQGKTLAQRTFDNEQDLTTSVTQLHIPNAANLTKRQLQYTLMTQIYYWLTSQQVAAALNNPQPLTQP